MKTWMVLSIALITAGCMAGNREVPVTNLYDIEVNRINGETVKLDD